MDILILGGTRFVGRFLVKEALKKGHRVTLFNRGSHSALINGVEQLVGDRNGDLQALAGRRWDAVIDTCGFVPRAVKASCQMLQHTDHYTYISSQSVYEDMAKPGLDEKDAVLTMDYDKVEEITGETAGPIYEYYGPLKALSEKAAEQKLPGKVLVVRAGQIVGPYDYTDRLPYWVKRVAEGGEVLAPGRPERPIQLIDAQDLAKWIISCIEKNITGTFNANGPEGFLTMGELLAECKRASQSDAVFTWVSEGFLEHHQVGAWGEMPLWLPEDYPLPGEEKPWNGFFTVNNTKAIQKGLTFRPLANTIKDVLEWETSRSDEERKAGMSRKREQELLQAWHQQVHPAL
ncbi:NAD-dependent epimerase/dehydratase family protein [Pseudobacillus wudalianchiensis]|uniref:NAD-dependent dehydratase n=1 Tax=Pseudobacillus wudalianchiensis TaxID=1743143 RepID=A0A1B9AAG9_9BACI|nr:NAD-dependent epimerase/dehydratase family protein [Bacillus wudalianchiensis]OCA80843.1 NAD-dependent dehydratase [Bacillus wudalianchiensis]